MKLVNVLREECLAAGMKLPDKASALKAVAEAAKKCDLLKDISVEKIFEGLNQREKLGTTGFGKGIAIPHCRLDGVQEFVVGIITVPEGVEFEAIDGEKVKLIVFIIAPQNASNAHVRLLSAISQILLVPGSIKEMLAAVSSEALMESFLRHSRGEIEVNGKSKRSILHVFVQNEDKFRDILTALAGTGSSNLSIVTAENPGAYLSKMPLFADFWTDNSSSFCRIIVSVVDSGLVNETIRRIESITGQLNQQSGVMVTVQEVGYAAGVLEG